MALEDLMKGECPSEILSEEGTRVAYYNDVEENRSHVSGNQAALKCLTNCLFFLMFCLLVLSRQFTNGRTGTAVKNCSFCGQWSLMNAEVLYTKDFGDSYGEISLDSHPMVTTHNFPTLARLMKNKLKCLQGGYVNGYFL